MGESCSFCHYPMNAPTSRPKKTKRQSVKSELQELMRKIDIEQQPKEVWNLQQFAQTNAFARMLCEYEVERLVKKSQAQNPTDPDSSGIQFCRAPLIFSL